MLSMHLYAYAKFRVSNPNIGKTSFISYTVVPNSSNHTGLDCAKSRRRISHGWAPLTKSSSKIMSMFVRVPYSNIYYRSGSLKQKYSRLSEVSQLMYRTGSPGNIGWAYVAWRAGTKSVNLAQPCLKRRLQFSPADAL
jgi:hypothetical protein